MAFMKEKDLGDLVILGLIFHSDNALAKNAILINLCKNSLSLILSLSLSLSLILTLTSACTIFLSRLHLKHWHINKFKVLCSLPWDSSNDLTSPLFAANKPQMLLNDEP